MMTPLTWFGMCRKLCWYLIYSIIPQIMPTDELSINLILCHLHFLLIKTDKSCFAQFCISSSFLFVECFQSKQTNKYPSLLKYYIFLHRRGLWLQYFYIHQGNIVWELLACKMERGKDHCIYWWHWIFRRKKIKVVYK